MTEGGVEQQLMQTIHAKFADAIHSAVSGTAIPESLLAGMIANESGGDPEVKRFEPAVLGKLWAAVMGRRSSYGRISAVELKDYLTAGGANTDAVLRRLDELATSWGLTQIMGYHILEWASIPAWYRDVSDLRDPARNLKCAALLLTQFANQFSLDLSKDFEPLLRCWNTGQPDGKTFDANYVANALSRSELYSA
jgi:Transglycosylase SLT domain